MRVLIVTNIYPTPETPTAGTFVAAQVEGLRRIGLDPEILYVDRARRGYRAYLGLARRVAEQARVVKADVIHAMYGGIMADRVTRGAGRIPSLVSFCGSDLMGETLSGAVQRLAGDYGILCSYQAARRASSVIVKSRRLAEVLPKDVDPRKVTVIPSGVDQERFRPLDRAECRARLGFRSEGFHILFAYGAGATVKRIGLAEAAVAAARVQQADVELHVMQGVPPDEVPLWLNASDCLLLTSLHEGSPNVVKEALACNVPVVSVDVGDVAERLEGLEGCWIASDTSEALGEKLLQVYSGPRRVEARGKIEELGIEPTSRRLKALYEQVCNTGDNARKLSEGPSPVVPGFSR